MSETREKVYFYRTYEDYFIDNWYAWEYEEEQEEEEDSDEQ